MKIPDTLPWKISDYRPFGIIARDPKESTYEIGDDKFSQFIRFSGNFDQQKENAEYTVKACNLFPELVEALEMVLNDSEFNVCGESSDTANKIKKLLEKAK